MPSRRVTVKPASVSPLSRASVVAGGAVITVGASPSAPLTVMVAEPSACSTMRASLGSGWPLMARDAPA